MKPTAEELKQILDMHAVWLANREGGKMADLRWADLCGARLRGANLSGADLCGANLPKGYRIARLDFGGWSICVYPTRTVIGCEDHPNEEWLKWTPDDVRGFAAGAKAFWTQHGEAIKAVIRDVMGENE